MSNNWLVLLFLFFLLHFLSGKEYLLDTHKKLWTQGLLISTKKAICTMESVFTNLKTISLHKKTYFEFHFWSGLKLEHITLPPSKIFMTKNINSLDPVPTTIWSELIYNPSCRCHWEIAWRNSNVPERNHGQGHSIFYR